jgi:gamma-glutamylcyclotransferase (GGCT)/AIG2-like uncharacterized protein YtfP
MPGPNIRISACLVLARILVFALRMLIKLIISSECLRRLDMLESNGLLYQREIIPTIATGQEGKEQRVHAWIYLWLKNPGLGSIEASFGKRVCYNNGCFFWT